MSYDMAIKIENLGKVYQIYERPENRLKQSISSWLHRLFGGASKRYYREFQALNGITFEVKKGETVGIIGHNGAGKSTLLQIICGTLSPTQGSVEILGNIGALLELGSGFDHDFTGRENVYMNGAILGLSSDDISAKFDDIVAFADIGDFIDQPVKTYSSGMLVRLAFAVQAQTNPDVLIVDEALAVGDAKFQIKCFERIKKLKERGTSILLVTHSGEQIVTHCDRAILLSKGECLFQGEPRTAVNMYMDLLFGVDKNLSEEAENIVPDIANKRNRGLIFDHDVFDSRPGYNPSEYRWGDKRAQWNDYQLIVNGKEYPFIINPEERVEFRASAVISRSIKNPIIGFAIKTKEGVTVYNTNSELLQCSLVNLGGDNLLIISEVSFLNHLGPGDYFISIGIASRDNEDVTPHDRRYDVIHFLVPKVDTFSGLFNLNAKMENNVVTE